MVSKEMSFVFVARSVYDVVVTWLCSWCHVVLVHYGCLFPVCLVLICFRHLVATHRPKDASMHLELPSCPLHALHRPCMCIESFLCVLYLWLNFGLCRSLPSWWVEKWALPAYQIFEHKVRLKPCVDLTSFIIDVYHACTCLYTVCRAGYQSVIIYLHSHHAPICCRLCVETLACPCSLLYVLYCCSMTCWCSY